MRVTIGERLGIPRVTARVQLPPAIEDITIDALIPEGDSLVLSTCPSSSMPWGECERRDDDGPPRVRGEMVWLHKTAPTLVIEGHPGLSPDDHAAGRRR